MTAERPGIADLLSRIVTELRTLARQQVALGRAELARKGRAGAIGAAALGAAALLGLLALALLLTGAVLGLALVVPAWAAALIVAGALLAGAGALALVGLGSLRKAAPPVPEQAVSSFQETIDWARARLRALPNGKERTPTS